MNYVCCETKTFMRKYANIFMKEKVKKNIFYVLYWD